VKLLPVVLAAAVLLMAGCSNRSIFSLATPTPTSTQTSAHTPTPTASPAGSQTPATTPTATASGAASPTPTASPGSNVISMVVNGGLNGNVANQGYVSLIVCTPGSTTACQTISNILVDSGSVGLRIFASVLPSNINLQQVMTGGQSAADCAAFADGTVLWGPVQTAGVQLAGEAQVSVPVHVVGATSFAGIPAACSNQGSIVLNSPSQAGYNGILGIGPFPSDTVSTYFGCTSTGTCSELSSIGAAQQVANPIVSLPADNNGLLVQLPLLGGSGAPTASGSLILGIGTQSNNALGSAVPYTTDSLGNLTAVYKSLALTSFFDTGSNGFFFNDSSIPGCTGGDAGFYCPGSTLSLSAQVSGLNGQSASVPFSIADASALFATGNTAFNNIGGSFPRVSDFDWGMPFFFGRNVFIAIQGRSTPAGPGPYFAF